MTRAYVCHLLLMSLYITVLHTIPAPANLTIVSQNFRHILQWSPGIASPPRTVFNVKQSCEGSKKPGKSAVRVNVTRATVDVSKALRNIYTYCTFSVWASLGNARSAEVNTSITPYEDTSIGPPDVSLSGCGNCLKISISPPPDTPLTPQTGRFYNSVEYKISWRKAGQTEAEHISTLKNQTVLQNLQPGQQYCVKVLPQINSNPNTQESEWKCEYTSRVEPRGGLYVMNWSLGASVPGVAALLLALGLVYTGFLCKLKTPPLKSLSNIVSQAHYLIPEETSCERVSSTEAQLTTASTKNYPTKPNNTLNVEDDSGNPQHELNYANKADSEDEEDEEEEDRGVYMGCVIDDSGWGTNESEEKAIVSSSHSREAAVEEIRRGNLVSELFDPHTHTHSDASGNVSLFSVTLRALGPQESGDCKPLLLESVLRPCASDDCVLEEEEEEEELLLEDTRPDVDSPSGYMLTHAGNMSGLTPDTSSEECDTDYITR
ncbi:cytokine receptor family member b1 [Pimephales promelas]|uniref:cytokine receptor family member b1 n=1 Tax=Pimephales promelas TaxID=90988 RepID=UPI0019557C00|nr:cytokine receptor family member b1 [Pimephales promelas]XP_039521787.1 cytokine receptor family member b1 [Pimephales promelas]KAG1929095.1 interleukin-10 receptor subunit beta [Pimephales promelas]